MTQPPLYISVPAWGNPYIDLAVHFTIPAIKASLLESKFTDIHFVIHTNNSQAFDNVLFSWQKRFIAPMIPGTHDGNWIAFKQAHKDLLALCPVGGIAVLLNSDVVVSRETFSVVGDAIEDGKKVVVSVGIRTSVEQRDSNPPIGASANELFKWIWRNKHNITEQAIWGKGTSQHPTILFFENETLGNVSLHCFHLTPMFILKDRELQFAGTIDDDLLEAYSDDEILYLKNGEAAFCEMSSDAKQHRWGKPLNVDSVYKFGHERFSSSHKRNFRQRMRVLGNSQQDDPAVQEILERLG